MSSFNIGFLRSVNTSIVESLNEAEKKTAELRMDNRSEFDADLFLHKAIGALRMIGLEGCNLVLVEAEKLALAVKEDRVVMTEGQEALMSTLLAVKKYLKDLLEGEKDIPAKLFIPFQQMKTVLKEKPATALDLFFPNFEIKYTAQNKGLKGVALENAIRIERPKFQAALVKWIKDSSDKEVIAESQQVMQNVVQQLEFMSDRVAYSLYWKTVHAFLSLMPHLDENLVSEFRGIISKVDLEMRNFSGGMKKPADDTFRMMLYYLAQTPVSNDSINQVKQMFDLSQYWSDVVKGVKESKVNSNPIDLGEIKALLEKSKEELTKILEGNGADPEKFQKLCSSLTNKIAAFQNLSVKKLSDAVSFVAQKIEQKELQLTHLVAEEVAFIFVLLEGLVSRNGRCHADFAEQVNTAVKRLSAALKNQPEVVNSYKIPELDEQTKKENQREALEQTIKELQNGLEKIEEVLDVFIREDGYNVNELDELTKPIKSMVGVIKMLDLHFAASVLEEIGKIIQSMKTEELTESNVEKLTTGIGGLALYLDAVRDDVDTSNIEDSLSMVFKKESEDLTPTVMMEDDDQPEESTRSTIEIDFVVETETVPAVESKEHEGLLVVSQAEKLIESDQKDVKKDSDESLTLIESEKLKDEPSDPELTEVYLEETVDIFASMDEALIALKENLNDRESLTNVRRAFHTLKGSGRMVGLTLMGNEAWEAEDYLNKWIHQEKPASSELIEVIRDIKNLFKGWVDELTEKNNAWVSVGIVKEFLNQLNEVPLVEEKEPETRGLSKGLIDVFKSESSERLQVLIDELAQIKENRAVSEDFMRAAHTFGSIGKTVGFPSISRLGYELEQWAQDRLLHNEAANENDIGVLERSISTLQSMIEAVEQKLDPIENEELLSDLVHLVQTNQQNRNSKKEDQELLVFPLDTRELNSVSQEDLTVPEDTVVTMTIEENLTVPEEAIVSVAVEEAQVVPEEAVVTVAVEEDQVVPEDAVVTVAVEEDQVVPEDAVVTVAVEKDQVVPEDAVVTVAVEEAQLVPEEAVVTVAVEEAQLVPEDAVATVAVEEAQLVPEDAVATVAVEEDQVVPEDAVATVAVEEDQVVPEDAVATVAVEEAQLVPEDAVVTVAVGEVQLVPGDAIVTSGEESDEDVFVSVLTGAANDIAAVQVHLNSLQERLMTLVSHIQKGALKKKLSESDEGADAIAFVKNWVGNELLSVMSTIDSIVNSLELTYSSWQDGLENSELKTIQAEELVTMNQWLIQADSQLLQLEGLIKEPEIDQSESEKELTVDSKTDELDSLFEISQDLRKSDDSNHREITYQGYDWLNKVEFIKDDIDESLLPVFKDEAQELVPKIAQMLRDLNEKENDQLIRELHRALHTVKGSARMVGALKVGALIHEMESSMEKIDSGKLDLKEVIETLNNQFDLMENWIDKLFNPEKEVVTVNDQKDSQEEDKVDLQVVQKVIRVNTSLIDQWVNEAGEVRLSGSAIAGGLEGMKKMLQELGDNTHRLSKMLRELETQTETQMAARRVIADEQSKEFDPLELDRFSRTQELARFIAEGLHDIVDVQTNLSKLIKEQDSIILHQEVLMSNIQQSLMNVRLVKFNTIADRLYKVVRQTSKELGKLTKLDIIGEDLEVDRGVLDRMIAPLEHLLRNAVAHGIELPEIRVHKGKSEVGVLTLKVSHEGNLVSLVMEDDGQGLNEENVLKKGLEKGLIKPHEVHDISKEKLIELIFKPGFSTAEEVNQVAGRGVGMDVVKNEITSLGGQISVSSEKDKGMNYKIVLPVSLATSQAILVETDDQLWAIPAEMVDQIHSYKSKEMHEIKKIGYVKLDGVKYHYAYLSELLGAESKQEEKSHHSLILIASGDKKLAVHVDQLLGTREIVVKKLGKQLTRVSGITGATVLGDGRLGMIINPVLLSKHKKIERILGNNVLAVVPNIKKPTVMIVDDSLTIRKATSKLLERAGFEILTAKDGINALEVLQSSRPDVILSDVEMPRMDGFELLKNIKGDKKYQTIPVIMITSRTAEKHKNTGLSLGANAYLGKPYKEDELLDSIRKVTSIQHEETIRNN